MSQDMTWEEIVAKFELGEKIKDLQKDWQKKCNDALSKLCLEDVKKCCITPNIGNPYYYYENLKENVCQFLESLYLNANEINYKNSDIVKRHVSCIGNVRYSFRDQGYFLNLISKYNLQDTHTAILGVLKEEFGDQLNKTNSTSFKCGSDQKKEICALDCDLWKKILTTAKIHADKKFEELSEQEVFNIINLHDDIFGLYNRHKQLVLYPEFWDEVHTKDPELLNLEKTAKTEIPKQKDIFGCAYDEFEKMRVSLNSFWDVFNRNSLDDIYEQLQDYFSCNLEKRRDHILKKVLTADFVPKPSVDIENNQYNKKKYGSLGGYIKHCLKNYTNNSQKADYIYYSLGEFFGGAFIDAIGKDNIKKYYEDNKIESDLFRDETECKKNSLGNTNANVSLNTNQNNQEHKEENDNVIDTETSEPNNRNNGQKISITSDIESDLFQDQIAQINIVTDKNENKIEQIKDSETDRLIKQNSNSENSQAQNFVQDKEREDEKRQEKREKQLKRYEKLENENDSSQNFVQSGQNELQADLNNGKMIDGQNINKAGIKPIDQNTEKEAVEKASDLQFYKKGFWISLGGTLVSGAVVILFDIFLFIAVSVASVVTAGYFLWQFQKNKLRQDISDNFTSVSNCQDGYHIDLNQNQKTETMGKIKCLSNDDKNMP